MADRSRPRLAGRARYWVDQPMARVALRARFTRPYYRLRFRRFGSGSVLHRPDWLYGMREISVGDGVQIFHGAWLSVEMEAWGGSEPTIEIGDGAILMRYVGISAAESVVIEPYAAIGAFTTMVDSDHTFDGPSPNASYNRPLLTSPIRVGRGTWVGDRVAILRGAQIGRFCVIGANSVVRGEIPDFSVAVGVPARIVGSTEQQARHHLVDG